jgi:predicted Zn-dependent peptidase
MRIFRVVFTLTFIVLSLSCAHKKSSFITDNLKTFHEFKLQNGIPVVVKISKQSRLRSVVLTLQGGKDLVPEEKAGIDTVTMKLTNMESKKYSEISRRTILKKSSASIGVSDAIDFSSYTLKTIDSYFDKTFDLYADLFLNPLFSQKYFDEIITNMKNSYRSDLTDGYARVSKALNLSFFKGHPYSSYLYNIETLESIKLEEVKAFYNQNYVASRIAIFAVGDFNLEGLKKKLHNSFGQLKKGDPFDTPAQNFALDETLPLILDPYNELKKEVSYVRGNFATVPVTHPDHWAIGIASNILSDILQNIIRTKNSMVYSVWSNNNGKKSNYANISAYRTNDPIKVIDLIKESIAIAASGKCLSPYKGDGSEEDYIPVSEGLEFYKASSSTKYFSGLRTNQAIASRMAGSYMSTGDYTSYLKTMDRINAVTAGEVKTAVRKYFKNNNIWWAVTAHPDIIEELKDNHLSYSPEYKISDLN